LILYCIHGCKVWDHKLSLNCTFYILDIYFIYLLYFLEFLCYVLLFNVSHQLHKSTFLVFKKAVSDLCFPQPGCHSSTPTLSLQSQIKSIIKSAFLPSQKYLQTQEAITLRLCSRERPSSTPSWIHASGLYYMLSPARGNLQNSPGLGPVCPEPSC